MRALVPALLFATTLVTPLASIETTWPRLRGHGGRAVSAVASLPTRWSFDAKSGREVYKTRVGGVGNTFSVPSL